MTGLLEPGNRRRVHFIGIGGISMSGLARILAAQGHQVSGCDQKPSRLTQDLNAEGIKVDIGHDPAHLDGVDVVVYTAAIRPDQPELAEAYARNLVVLKRAALLGEVAESHSRRVAVSGTHGKTTTTGMLGLILAEAGLDPTIALGGELDALGGNVRLGNGRIFLAEADEYVESFLHLRPTLALILNIEPDHPDFYKDLAHLLTSFRSFAALVPADGYLVARTELPNVAQAVSGAKAGIVGFGQDPGADYHPRDISFDARGLPSFIPVAFGHPLERVQLAVPGRHNILNALAALAAATILGVDTATTLAVLERFKGTKRRFEHKGTYYGAFLIDDYAHHPTEVNATLTAARETPHNRIWCVFQPHTYSRTKSLLDEFAHALSLADRIIVTDIYAAREVDLGEIHASDLARRINESGHEAAYIPTFEQAADMLAENVNPGDLVITMGAGDVFRVGDMLLARSQAEKGLV